MKIAARGFVLAAVLVTAAAAPAAEPVDWSGWYAGAFGGYMDGKLTSNDPGHFESTGDFDDNSPLVGLLAGVNRQTAGGWVLGGELLVPLYIQKGTAVDTEFFPDADPRVIYEAVPKWSVLVGGKAGRPVGRWLPYIYGAVGLANADGKTINLDNDNVYSPGAEQIANATHLVYQIGAGGDCQAGRTVLLGVRVLGFNSNQKQYEMPWNVGERNNFGMKSLLVQVHAARRF